MAQGLCGEIRSHLAAVRRRFVSALLQGTVVRSTEHEERVAETRPLLCDGVFVRRLEGANKKMQWARWVA